jgi:hypothetical protein
MNWAPLLVRFEHARGEVLLEVVFVDADAIEGFADAVAEFADEFAHVVVAGTGSADGARLGMGTARFEAAVTVDVTIRVDRAEADLAIGARVVDAAVRHFFEADIESDRQTAAEVAGLRTGSTRVVVREAGDDEVGTRAASEADLDRTWVRAFEAAAHQFNTGVAVEALERRAVGIQLDAVAGTGRDVVQQEGAIVVDVDDELHCRAAITANEEESSTDPEGVVADRHREPQFELAEFGVVLRASGAVWSVTKRSVVAVVLVIAAREVAATRGERDAEGCEGEETEGVVANVLFQLDCPFLFRSYRSG